MADLPALLRLAADGLHLFPIKAGRKNPPLITDWEHAASRDPAQIESWHTANPGCNWGVATGPSGLVVVDLDVKKGKNGRATLFDLEIEHGTIPASLRVSTPTGGEHVYLRGRAASSVERLGNGVDTRGVGGYVVAPGSVVDGMPYTVVSNGVVADAPTWVVQLAGAPIERKADAAPVVETEGKFAQAAAWLRTAEPAVEGAGGNGATFKVAARLRDFGVAEHTALTLMLAGWNDRCSPPWAEDELARVVANAYRYAKNEPGAASAEAAFASVPPADPNAAGASPASLFEEGPTNVSQAGLKVKLASEIDETLIKPREWILGNRFLRNFLTLTIAPGGVGKSTLAIHEAMAVASGDASTLGGLKVDPGPAWYYSTEDPMDELDRRVIACARFHRFAPQTLKALHLSSGRERPLVLVRDSGKGPEFQEGNIKACIDYIKQNGIKLFIVDPFVRSHQVDENDNMAIDRVAQAFTRIAAETHCAVHLVHHTRKRAGGAGGEGDMDSARGASSLVSAARIAHTLCHMNEKDAKTRGLEGERKWYVRLDDAKANLAPPQDKEVWFRKHGQEVGGEKVGVLRLEAPKTVEKAEDEKPEKKAKGKDEAF